MRKLALLGLVAAIQLGAADPRIGSWTLISAQSSLDPPNKLSITSLQRWSARSDFGRYPHRFHGEVGRT